MTAISNIKSVVYRVAFESKLTTPAARGMARDVAVMVLWGLVAIFMGLFVGASAIILPVTGTAGIVGVFALILLWVAPELGILSDKLVRRLFFIVVAVDLSLPTYYTVQFPGSPWISLRRIVTFSLIVVFALAISTSSATRQTIAANLRGARLISICVLGFLAMIVLSVPSSAVPFENSVADERGDAKLVRPLLCGAVCNSYRG